MATKKSAATGLFALIAQNLGTGTLLAAILGGIYLVDCRISAGKDRQAADNCYLVGLPMMGIGVAGKSAFNAGFNTYNPMLKDPKETTPKPPARRAPAKTEPKPRSRKDTREA